MLIATLMVRAVARGWMAMATLWSTLLRRVGRNPGGLLFLEPEHRRDGSSLAMLLTTAGLIILVLTSARAAVSGGRWVCGLAFYGLPVFTAAATARLARAPADPDSRGRVVLGWTAVGIGTLGALHIFAGGFAMGGGPTRLTERGGIVGFLVSAPLSSAVTPYVAAPVLLMFAVFGLLVVTATPIRQVPERLREARNRLLGGLDTTTGDRP